MIIKSRLLHAIVVTVVEMIAVGIIPHVLFPVGMFGPAKAPKIQPVKTFAKTSITYIFAMLISAPVKIIAIATQASVV